MTRFFTAERAWNVALMRRPLLNAFRARRTEGARCENATIWHVDDARDNQGRERKFSSRTPDHIKPSGRLLRALISHPARVRIAKVANPDASLLRLETPATRPLPGAGHCARSGRGDRCRPPESEWRPHARRNVPAPLGLSAFE